MRATDSPGAGVPIELTLNGERYAADLARPISLALPLRASAKRGRAWGAAPLTNEPVRVGDWVGDVDAGSAVNFAALSLTPHGSGTHTETVAHITKLTADNSVAAVAPLGMLAATLVDVPLRTLPDGGRVADLRTLRGEGVHTAALVLRALGTGHVDIDFTGTDPPYLDAGDVAWLVEEGVEHLVTDLPSLDRERDGGALAAHRAFWKFPERVRGGATVTELARLNQALAPGLYLLSLNALPLEADASPSHPILYALNPAN